MIDNVSSGQLSGRFVSMAIPDCQVTLKVTKLHDVLFEKVMSSIDMPYYSLIESFFYLYGSDITITFSYSSFDDTPLLKGFTK